MYHTKQLRNCQVTVVFRQCQVTHRLLLMISSLNGKVEAKQVKELVEISLDHDSKHGYRTGPSLQQKHYCMYQFFMPINSRQQALNSLPMQNYHALVTFNACIIKLNCIELQSYTIFNGLTLAKRTMHTFIWVPGCILCRAVDFND